MRFILGLLALPLILSVACQAAVSQEDLDAAKATAASEAAKVTSLQQQLSDQVKKEATLQQTVTAGGAVIADKDKKIADLEKSGGGALAGVTTLLYAKAVPTSTPRPAPTPPPPGFTPAPAATVEPATSDEVLPFVVYAETLATSSVSKYGLASFTANSTACIPNAVFKRGTKLVWRLEVFDTKTGKRVTNLEKNEVTLSIPGVASDLTMRYSKRAGTGPWMWAAGWDIPTDYPLGALDWKLNIKTADGRTMTWSVPAIANERADSRVKIIE